MVEPVFIGEYPRRETFVDIVRDGQRRWREAKKNPITTISQAIDLPKELNGHVMNFSLRHLPNYISRDVAEKIRQAHPEPLIATSVLSDARVISESYHQYEVDYPAELKKDEERDNWLTGIILLNEFATESLAREIMTAGVSGKNTKISHWLRPAATYFTETGGAYKGYFQVMEKIFGEKNALETFRRDLVITMLTGNKSHLNTSLDALGYGNLDAFALKIGSAYWAVENASFREGAEVQEVPALGKTEDKVSVTMQLREALVIHGKYLGGGFPGVMHVNLLEPLILSSLNATAIALNFGPAGKWETLEQVLFHVAAFTFAGYMLARQTAPKIISLPKTFVHELVHYLSHDIGRIGFIPLKRK